MQKNEHNVIDFTSFYPTQYRRRLLSNDAIINQLEIPEALRNLLITHRITWDMLIELDSSDLAKILQIDEYIARLIIQSTKKKEKELRLLA